MLNWPSQRIQVRVRYVDPLVAAGLTTVLSQQIDMEVLPDDDDAPLGAQVVVADYEQALTLATRREGQNAPPDAAVKVLVVTPNDRENDVRSALDAGVDGYLELGCQVGELISGVRQLARGSRYLSQMAASRIASSIGRSTLTQREMDVLCLVARGHSNKVVAQKLDISAGTVKAHMKAILGKLNASTRTEAASIAQPRGLIAGGARPS